MDRSKGRLNGQIRVFHGIVNYGTQAGSLARSLRESGINAISVAGYDPFGRLIDIELKHGGSTSQKIYRHFLNTIFLFKCFFFYNIFHFYYGISLIRKNKDLPFLRFFKKKIIFHYLGNDVQLYKKSVKKYKITNMSYIVDQKDAKEYDKSIREKLSYRMKYSDLQFVCAPYLFEFVPDSYVLPLAIDLKEYDYNPKEIPQHEIIIMHAPTDRENKGTKYIIEAIDKLINEGFRIKWVISENITNEELKEKYKECDIYIDQILAGWYGFSAVEAMAIGRPVVCFIRKEYFQYISYGDEIPIINATPQNIYNVLKNLINNKNKFPEIAKNGRHFVERVHDVKLITSALIKYYSEI